jgi:hypothetical protein
VQTVFFFEGVAIDDRRYEIQARKRKQGLLDHFYLDCKTNEQHLHKQKISRIIHYFPTAFSNLRWCSSQIIKRAKIEAENPKASNDPPTTSHLVTHEQNPQKLYIHPRPSK